MFPFILAAALLQHSDKHEHRFAQELAANMYVDNLLIECETEEEAIDKSTLTLRPRNLWPMGIVVALNGSFPNVRSVQLQMPNGQTVTLPISRLLGDRKPDPGTRPGRHRVYPD
ncbi:hypothetical protein niasHT_036593 [Heterodera trifolii]|uniref:Uncharacterized protein n=1 Tax=Heterodera trifolii TaxID=157864 RepID=A0ABD2IQI0_9BILA